MNTKAAHTELPWQQTVAGIFGPTSYLGGVERIADISFSRGNDRAAANAELIVRAVNHHQELITRLYNLVSRIEIDSDIDGDIPNSLEYKEARETLKKVIQ